MRWKQNSSINDSVVASVESESDSGSVVIKEKVKTIIQKISLSRKELS